MRIGEKPLCSTCVHHNPSCYVGIWQQRHPAQSRALIKYIVERAYSKVHCRMVKRDAENFPHKLAELSNWDEEILPQHCGHYSKKPLLLLFSKNERGTKWDYIGGYSTYELCWKAENCIMYPHAIESFRYFCDEVPKSALKSITDNFFLKLPVATEDLTHQLVWDMLQIHNCDNDVFDKLNARDWLRSIFPRVGSINKWELMTRYGMYKMSTLRTHLKDLRSPKYAQGPVIDIRPCRPYAQQGDLKRWPPNGTWENDRRTYEQKWYVRISRAESAARYPSRL